MAYNITSTSGLTSYTITNGVINNQTNLSFIGKGALSYGSSLNTNFLRLLENFADVTEPDSPIIGQIWWDTSTNNLRVYDGVEFGIVTPPLDRITSSTIGNLEIASSSITGEITNGNINIGPNGTGNTVINRLAILNTGVGKVPYTAANGMIVTSTLSFNPTDNTLTATNLSATNIAGTLTTGPQAAITSVGTLDNLTVAGNITTTGGNIGIGTTTPVGNVQIQSANESPVVRLTNSSSAFSTTPDFNNLGGFYGGPGFGTGASILIFERTSTFSRNSNSIGGIYWKNTLTNGYVINSSITSTSSNNATSSPGNIRLFYKAGTQHRFDTWTVNPNGTFNADTSESRLSITSFGSAFLGNLTIGNSNALGGAPPTNYSALHVYGNIIGYFNGPIGSNASANTGVFTSMISNSLSLSSDSSSTLFTMTGSSASGGVRANLISTGTGSGAVPLLLFSRTSTSTTAGNGGLGWLKTLTDGSTVQSSIYVNGTNTAGSPSTIMAFTSPNGYSFIGGDITGYFTGSIGANTANTGAFTTLTTTSTANVGNLVTTSGVYWANGNAFTSSGGATGGSIDKAFWENDTTITTSYTITAGKNAGTFGPVTINSGATVTIPSGSVWSIV